MKCGKVDGPSAPRFVALIPQLQAISVKRQNHLRLPGVFQISKRQLQFMRQRDRIVVMRLIVTIVEDGNIRRLNHRTNHFTVWT